MKTIIHVNQHVIKANRKNGTNEPCLTTKTYKSNDYGHEVIIKDKAGNEVARVVYSRDKPLSCGAHCWIETQNKVEVINHNVPLATLPYGRFTECTVCAGRLRSENTIAGKSTDPEHLTYHGYCSTTCASNSNYTNYQI